MKIKFIDISQIVSNCPMHAYEFLCSAYDMQTANLSIRKNAANFPLSMFPWWIPSDFLAGPSRIWKISSILGTIMNIYASWNPVYSFSIYTPMPPTIKIVDGVGSILLLGFMIEKHHWEGELRLYKGINDLNAI